MTDIEERMRNILDQLDDLSETVSDVQSAIVRIADNARIAEIELSEEAAESWPPSLSTKLAEGAGSGGVADVEAAYGQRFTGARNSLEDGAGSYSLDDSPKPVDERMSYQRSREQTGLYYVDEFGYRHKLED